MLDRLQSNQRVSLRLTPLAGRTLALAVVLTLVLAAILEGAARTSFVQSRVPFQAYGSNHIQFELQINKLKAFAAQHGAPECLILGTSQSLRGIDPKNLSQAYLQKTGKELHCYNFSIVGANLITTASFSKILVDAYHPNLIILGTSFLDYTQAREKRFDSRFQENAWLDYQVGRFSLEGWLVDHSYAYRLLMLVSYSAPDSLDFRKTAKEVRKWDSQLTDEGYGYSEEVIDPWGVLDPGEIKNFLEEFDDFSVSQQNMDSLGKIVQEAQQKGVQVIIVEMPYHPSLVELRGLEGASYQEIRSKLGHFIQQVDEQTRQIASQYAIPYWTASQAGEMPNRGWHDRYHLNKYGSAVFSQWLAESIAQAITTGQIADPGVRQ